MAGSSGSCGKHPFIEYHFSRFLPDGGTDRDSLSGLRHDEKPVFAFDGKSGAVRPDAPDGPPGGLHHIVLYVEPVYTRQNGERNKIYDRFGDCPADCFILYTHVSIFPIQRTVCLYGR